MSARLLRVTALALMTTGCGGEAPIAQPPDVDRARFEREVYPVLLRDCGFPACHGDPDRFFRVFGPGRTRLDPASGLYAPPSTAEIDGAFDRARSMLSGAPDPERALLLRKPLEASAGGAAHMGSDALGRNVYASTADPDWRAIAAWAGAMLDPVDGAVLDGAVLDGAVLDGASVADDGSVERDAASIAD
ncbi:MAG: hypothetical protein M3Y87_25370, partial [Myxococcota bacterium]|nr:hypothetical protein [Myxococcota bacterium]